jgi:hypothetical protein
MLHYRSRLRYPSTLRDAMPLLKYTSHGGLRLTEHFISDESVPPYATLSHTWREGQEVTYDDLVTGNGMDKAGHNKILFCARKAQRDGLNYSWVDTCCTIQTHHRRQCPTKRVAYVAENGGRMYIAFQYKRINISILMQPESGPPLCSG